MQCCRVSWPPLLPAQVSFFCRPAIFVTELTMRHAAGRLLAWRHVCHALEALSDTLFDAAGPPACHRHGCMHLLCLLLPAAAWPHCTAHQSGQARWQHSTLLLTLQLSCPAVLAALLLSIGTCLRCRCSSCCGARSCRLCSLADSSHRCSVCMSLSIVHECIALQLLQRSFLTRVALDIFESASFLL